MHFFFEKTFIYADYSLPLHENQNKNMPVKAENIKRQSCR